MGYEFYFTDTVEEMWTGFHVLSRSVFNGTDSVSAVALLQIVLFDFSIERSFADTEHDGGFFAFAAGQFKGAGDVILFDFIE